MFRGVATWVRSPGGVVCASALLTLVFAFLVNLGLDVWHVSGDTERLVRHTVTEEFPLFVLGTLVVWLFVLLLVGVTGRLWLSLGLVTTAALLLGFTNYQKQQLLTEPLYPSDFAFVADLGFLTDMVGWRPVAAVVVGAVALIAVSVLAGRWLSRWFPRPERRERPRLRWTLVGARVVAATTSVAALSYLMQFHDPGNVVKATYEQHGAQWRPWHQSANYTDNGFVAGMLYNLPITAMPKPPGYGPATMRELTDRYTGVAERINRGRTAGALDDVNVVLLLSESFSDPSRVKGVELARDPIPYTRSLMNRTTSGNVWSQKYGGGTANVEFEALTGMSLGLFRPQVTTPYQMLVPRHSPFPSSVGVLEEHGHDSLAMHSFKSMLYRRSEVYPILGFDNADFEDDFAHTDTLGRSQFISDAATYAEMLERIEASEQPLFVNAVTMQNHFPMAGKYADPIEATGLSDPDRVRQLEHYARGLRHTDAATRRLIESLKRSEEKTILVFYGDHLPSVWPPAMLSRRTMHETPFFVYANYGRLKVERLPTTSPIHFMNHVLEVADAPVPPYYALLQQVEQEVPAMGQGMLIGPDNRTTTAQELPPRARQLLRDYRLVQYDLSIGERYSARAMLTTDAGISRAPF